MAEPTMDFETFLRTATALAALTSKEMKDKLAPLQETLEKVSAERTLLGNAKTIQTKHDRAKLREDASIEKMDAANKAADDIIAKAKAEAEASISVAAERVGKMQAALDAKSAQVEERIAQLTVTGEERANFDQEVRKQEQDRRQLEVDIAATAAQKADLDARIAAVAAAAVPPPKTA